MPRTSDKIKKYAEYGFKGGLIGGTAALAVGGVAPFGLLLGTKKIKTRAQAKEYKKYLSSTYSKQIKELKAKIKIKKYGKNIINVDPAYQVRRTAVTTLKSDPVILHELGHIHYESTPAGKELKRTHMKYILTEQRLHSSATLKGIAKHRRTLEKLRPKLQKLSLKSELAASKYAIKTTYKTKGLFAAAKSVPPLGAAYSSHAGPSLFKKGLKVAVISGLILGGVAAYRYFSGGGKGRWVTLKGGRRIFIKEK